MRQPWMCKVYETSFVCNGRPDVYFTSWNSGPYDEDEALCIALSTAEMLKEEGCTEIVTNVYLRDMAWTLNPKNFAPYC